MAKGISKRAYHKRDMDNLKRKALTIGGVVAGISLLMIIISIMR